MKPATPVTSQTLGRARRLALTSSIFLNTGPPLCPAPRSGRRSMFDLGPVTHGPQNTTPSGPVARSSSVLTGSNVIVGRSTATCHLPGSCREPPPAPRCYRQIRQICARRRHKCLYIPHPRPRQTKSRRSADPRSHGAGRVAQQHLRRCVTTSKRFRATVDDIRRQT